MISFIACLQAAVNFEWAIPPSTPYYDPFYHSSSYLCCLITSCCQPDWEDLEWAIPPSTLLMTQFDRFCVQPRLPPLCASCLEAAGN